MTEWVNIPAEFLLPAYLCALIVAVICRPRRRKPAICIAAFLLVGLVYAAVLFFNPLAEGLQFFICMGMIWGGMVASLRFLTDMSWTAAAYHTVRTFFIAEFCASLSWQVAYYLMKRFSVTDKIVLFLSIIPVGYTVYFGVVYLIEKRFVKGDVDLAIQKKDLWTALFIGFFFYFMANISYVLSDSPFSTSDLAETYVRRTLTDFGAAAILLAYHLRIVDLQTRLCMQAMENMWQRQEEHFKTYEASIAMVNHKYHDLKHQLRMLREEASESKKQEYIAGMEKELETYDLQNKTGNPTLDTVLTAKSMECENAGITFTSVADGKALEAMDAMDINALFGNILDNAIECEEKIPDAEKRLIHLSVSRQKAWTRICVRNVCDREPVFREGLPVSTKGDDTLHGYGTASVKSIVEKYHGNLIMKWQDGWFEVSILL